MTEPCDHTTESKLYAGHTHTCNGAHLDEGGPRLHKCSGEQCRMWFA